MVFGEFCVFPFLLQYFRPPDIPNSFSMKCFPILVYYSFSKVQLLSGHFNISVSTSAYLSSMALILFLKFAYPDIYFSNEIIFSSYLFSLYENSLLTSVILILN
jgi:hypothetical protein